MYKYSLLFLLISSIFCVNITPSEDNSIEPIIKCIKGFSPLPPHFKEMISAIKSKDFDTMIEKLYQIIDDGNAGIINCLAEHPDISEFLQSLLPFDWGEFIKCITSTKPLAQDILELIKLIVNKEFDKVVSLLLKLAMEGTPIVKNCIKVFKEEKKISLGVNWAALKNCVSSITSPVCKGHAQTLVGYISKGNYNAAITKAQQMLSIGCLNGCSQFLF